MNELLLLPRGLLLKGQIGKTVTVYMYKTSNKNVISIIWLKYSFFYF